MSCENNCGPLVVTLLTGAPGIQGEQGVQGPEGPVGPQGPQGPVGSVGTVTGDVTITTEGVASLATVGVAAITGNSAQALTLQTDAKGRVLAVTAQAISVTTSQVQNLSLSTLGGVATTDPRLSDSRTPSGAAGGDLAGTYPNPTLGAIGTAGVAGAADKTLILQTDSKGRAVAVTAQAISVTTSQVQNLSLATLGGVATSDPRLSDSRTPSGSAGGDLTGTYPNPTLEDITTAKTEVGSATHVPLVSVDAKGRVTSLTSVQISALTTAQLFGLSTSTPAVLATSGAVGASLFAARADHVHALQTLGDPGTWGSGTVVPVVTVDSFGRVASVTTAEITGGAALSTQAPFGLASAGAAGTGAEAAAWDHRHPVSGDLGIGENETLKVQGALGFPFAPTHETIQTGYALVFQGTEWIARVLQPSDEIAQPLGVPASGNSAEFARADHVHENPCPDASNAEPENIGIASPGLSEDYSRADHVHALTTTIEAGTFGGSNGIPVLTVDNFGRITSVNTQAVANFSTLPALGLTTAGVVGMSGLAAQADHQHPITGDVTLFDPYNGTDVQVVGLRASPLAMMAPQQDQILTFDAGQWCPKDSSAAVTLSDANPAALGATAAPGTSVDASRADHQHLRPSLADLGAQAALTTSAPLAFSLGGTSNIAYTDGQLLIGNTATGGLSKAALTAGTNMTITNGSGSITLTPNTGATPCDVQVFTSSGTWTKSSGARKVEVQLVGGGGGGGSGRKGATSTVRSGGGGGGGAGSTVFQVDASALGETVSVTIGAGGTGGASQATNSTNGNVGVDGGDTLFGIFRARGGNGGGAGTTTTGSIGVGGAGQFTGGAGGTGGGSSASSNAVGATLISGGGGGGGINGSNTNINAANGGFINSTNQGAAGGGSSPSSPVAHGLFTMLGQGGGGGNASQVANAVSGAAAGLYGGGGGGGGAATDGVGNSGAGGLGTAGIVIVTTYF